MPRIKSEKSSGCRGKRGRVAWDETNEGAVSEGSPGFVVVAVTCAG